MIKVQNIQALNILISQGNHSYAIALTGGVISRKRLYRSQLHLSADPTYTILHCIDFTVQKNISEYTLLTETNIGKALKMGALYCMDTP